MGGYLPLQILKLTLYYNQVADFAEHITTCPSRFLELPLSLRALERATEADFNYASRAKEKNILGVPDS